MDIAVMMVYKNLREEIRNNINIMSISHVGDIRRYVSDTVKKQMILPYKAWQKKEFIYRIQINSLSTYSTVIDTIYKIIGVDNK